MRKRFRQPIAAGLVVVSAASNIANYFTPDRRLAACRGRGLRLFGLRCDQGQMDDQARAFRVPNRHLAIHARLAGRHDRRARATWPTPRCGRPGGGGASGEGWGFVSQSCGSGVRELALFPQGDYISVVEDFDRCSLCFWPRCSWPAVPPSVTRPRCARQPRGTALLCEEDHREELLDDGPDELAERRYQGLVIHYFRYVCGFNRPCEGGGTWMTSSFAGARRAAAV